MKKGAVTHFTQLSSQNLKNLEVVFDNKRSDRLLSIVSKTMINGSVTKLYYKNVVKMFVSDDTVKGEVIVWFRGLEADYYKSLNIIS